VFGTTSDFLREMGRSEAESLLDKVRKEPGNRECVNCKIQSRLGFGAVCVKFKTFVCNNCKSSHQAFSHRVKSVSMSEWTLDEVKTLESRNGGGNEACRARFFSFWTDEDAARFLPLEGDKLDKFKRLVQMVYEEKRFFDGDVPLPQPKSLVPKRKERVDVEKSSNMFGNLTIKSHASSSVSSTSANSDNGKSNDDDDELDLFGEVTNSISDSKGESLLELFSSPDNTMTSDRSFLDALSSVEVAKSGKGLHQNSVPSNANSDPFLLLQQPPRPVVPMVQMSRGPPQPQTSMQMFMSPQFVPQQQVPNNDDPFAGLQGPPRGAVPMQAWNTRPTQTPRPAPPQNGFSMPMPLPRLSRNSDDPFAGLQ